MITVQRKYKVIKASSAKELSEIVNECIQKEYKDTGFQLQVPLHDRKWSWKAFVLRFIPWLKPSLKFN